MNTATFALPLWLLAASAALAVDRPTGKSFATRYGPTNRAYHGASESRKDGQAAGY